MSWSIITPALSAVAIDTSSLFPSSSSSSSSCSSANSCHSKITSHLKFKTCSSNSNSNSNSNSKQKWGFPLHKTQNFVPRQLICKAAEYIFPDPIPEFADAETEKFKTHLKKKLIKKEVCGDSVEEVVNICTEIFTEFMHAEYGGPGTLLVLPFIDMADTLNERGLPGGPQAARVAVKWAQDNVDKDWKEWTSGNDK